MVTSTDSLCTTASEAQVAAKTLGGFKNPGVRTVFICSLLAAMAGMVNAIAFRNLGSFVSHTTGSSTQVGMFFEGAYSSDRNLPFDPMHAFLLVFTFMSGALLCGLIVWKNEGRFGTQWYGVAFIANSILLVVSGVLADLKYRWTLYILAAACGLQNGICTVHWGPTVRTTHVTGLATDLGLALGRISHIYFKACMCGRSGHIRAIERAEVAVDSQKVAIFLCLWSSFVLGAMSGSFLEVALAGKSLFVPAAIIFVLGVVYIRLERPTKKELVSMKVEAVAEKVGALQQQVACGHDAEAVVDAVRAISKDLEGVLEAVDTPVVLLGNTRAKTQDCLEKLPR